MKGMKGGWVFLAIILAVLAIAGWWRASSSDVRAGGAEANASTLKDTIVSLRSDTEGLHDDLEETKATVARLRTRAERAEANARDMQDCIALATDEDGAGSRTVLFGFIEPGGGRNLMVDEAEWYTGDDADRAAREDGEPEEEVLHDYYIRNDDRSGVTYPVARDAVIVTSTVSRHDIPAPDCMRWTVFQDIHSDPEPWQESLALSPYWLTISDGEVVRIVEQYLS